MAWFVGSGENKEKESPLWPPEQTHPSSLNLDLSPRLVRNGYTSICATRFIEICYSDNENLILILSILIQISLHPGNVSLPLTTDSEVPTSSSHCLLSYSQDS